MDLTEHAQKFSLEVRQVLDRLLDDMDTRGLHDTNIIKQVVKGFPSRLGLGEQALVLPQGDGHRRGLCRHMDYLYVRGKIKISETIYTPVDKIFIFFHFFCSPVGK